MKTTIRYLLALSIALSTSIATGHHSHGNYQIGTEITIQGVVTEAHIANPHVWVFLDVENPMGTIENWALESGGAAGFRRSGWDHIAPGDNVSVTCAPTRDGANGCFIENIQFIHRGSSWDSKLDQYDFSG